MKRVLITGASSGIGASTAKLAGAAGWDVIVGYAQGSQRAMDVAKTIQAQGGHAQTLSINLNDPEAILQSLDTLSGSLDALVLCASPKPRLASFLKTNPEILQEQWLPNVIGNQCLLAETWKRFFRPANKGHVIGVLSAASGSPPWAHMSAYVLGKRALLSLLESALSELGTSGLRVTTLSPDYTETPMLTTLDPRILEAAKSRRPGGKFLQPEDVASEILRSLENPPEAGRLEAKTLSIEGAAS